MVIPKTKNSNVFEFETNARVQKIFPKTNISVVLQVLFQSAGFNSETISLTANDYLIYKNCHTFLTKTLVTLNRTNPTAQLSTN